MEKYDNQIELKDILITLSDYKSELLEKKIKIIVIAFLFIIAGVFILIIPKEEFKAELTFIVENDKNSVSLGSMAGIASNLGFDLGSISSSASSTFSQNNIIELLKSRGVIFSTLMQKQIVDGSNNLLIEHYLDINGIKESWLENDNFKSISFDNNLTYVHDSISTYIWKEIIEGELSISFINDESNIIQLSYKSFNQEFAKQFVEVLINEMEKMYVEHQTRHANQTIEFLKNRADSVFQELQRAEEEFANVKDINQRIVKASGRLRELQLMREVEVLNIMYIELVKNLEVSKLTLLNQTPIINIIDTPILPLKGDQMSKIMAILLAAILGIISATLLFVFNKLFKDALSEK